MPLFDVRYVESSRLVQRRVEAPDAQGVAAVLGVAPQLVASAHGVDAGLWACRFALPTQRFPLRLFSQELSVLLGAGIPLLEALQTLREKESTPTVAGALDAVAASLRQGLPLSKALADQPAAFDELFVAVVTSAERTGQLRDALRQHADYLAWTEQLKARVVGALVYPAILVAASGAVVLFLLLFVVPRFAGVLDGVAGTELPLASQWLMAAGQSAAQHIGLTLLIAAVLAVAPVLAWQAAPLRRALQRALWRAPLIGRSLRLLALTRLYRTLGMLLDAGVPLVPALRTAGGVTAAELQPSLVRATDDVARGGRLSASLQAHGLATPVALRMVRVGESSGALGPMLGQAAGFHDEEAQRIADLVGRFVNPALMLLMGGIIGSIVVLLYLPIFQIAEQMQ